jgi:biotin carboxylase
MKAAGVPCVPGSEGRAARRSEGNHAIARAIGYPVIIKAAAAAADAACASCIPKRRCSTR